MDMCKTLHSLYTYYMDITHKTNTVYTLKLNHLELQAIVAGLSVLEDNLRAHDFNASASGVCMLKDDLSINGARPHTVHGFEALMEGSRNG